jgi:hypothetical protein
MSNASTLCFRVTLIVAIVCFSVVAGHAGTVPELTGTFEPVGLGNNPAGPFTVSFPPNPFVTQMTFSQPANLPSQTTMNCAPQGCFIQTDWNGSAVGGGVDMVTVTDTGIQTINMTGLMTGGTISGFLIECTGILICDGYNWDYDFTFRGIWSNGWFTDGSASIRTGVMGDAQGTVTMTTFDTPEPETIALLSAGIVCGWRSWRRRNRILV